MMFLLLLFLFRDSLCYIPGVSSNVFESDDNVMLYVNKLTSTKTQVPFDYYSLPFCHPKVHMIEENVGEVLSGDRIENSLYKLQFRTNRDCRVVCRHHLTKDENQQFIDAIEEEYRVHWIVDNLPAGMELIQDEMRPEETYFTRGFPVGFSLPDTGSKSSYFLYNHIRIVISYNLVAPSEQDLNPQNGYIVGFRVELYSIRHSFTDEAFDPDTTILSSCNSQSNPETANAREDFQKLSSSLGSDVIFTYDIHWVPSDVTWSHRWDVYLFTSGAEFQVHWFAIINSTVMVLFLTSMIAVILIRTLRRDIARYNVHAAVVKRRSIESPAAAEDNDDKEETGWKLVHADVFRPPSYSPLLLSVFIGTGVQLLLMILFSVFFALIGLLSPTTHRGSLLTGFIFLYICMAAAGGYSTSRSLKLLKVTNWKQGIMWTALGFPSLVFLVFLLLNIVLWIQGSSSAVPFSTLFTLLFLWLGVSSPLVVFGAFLGFKSPLPQFPVRVNVLPRIIPAQPWYLNAVMSSLIGGLLPFAAVSVEVFFILSALWLHHIYYIFGFLFLVTFILILTCGEVSILQTYFQLCNEDYNWHWRAFASSASMGVYLLLYSIWYHMTELDLGTATSILVYYSYMGVVCLMCGLVTGCIGYYACFQFNWIIYGSIKVD